MFDLSSREARFAFVIASSHFSQHFLMRLIPPLIPILAVSLEYSLWELGLLLSVVMVGSGFGQAPLGILSDRYDRRYILPTGIVLSGVSYVVFAYAPAIGAVLPSVPVFGHTFHGGFVVMAVTMFVMGLGTAVVHPTGYPMITANVTDSNQGKILGVFGSSSKVGDAAAPAIVGVLVLVLVWDQILVLLGLVGVLLGIGLFVALGSDEYVTTPVGRMDDGTDGDESTDSQHSDRRTYLYPLVVIYVFWICKKIASNGINSFFPVYVVSVYAYSFEVADVSLAPESVANFYFALLLLFGAVSQLVFGVLIDRYDPRSAILVSAGVATAGLLLLSLFDLSPLALLLVVLVMGVGLWGVNPGRDALISEITPPKREGRTFGYIWTATQLTGAGIPVLVGYLIETVGMREGFLVLALGTLLAGASIILLYTDRIYLSEPDPDASVETSD